MRGSCFTSLNICGEEPAVFSFDTHLNVEANILNKVFFLYHLNFTNVTTFLFLDNCGKHVHDVYLMSWPSTWRPPTVLTGILVFYLFLTVFIWGLKYLWFLFLLCSHILFSSSLPVSAWALWVPHITSSWVLMFYQIFTAAIIKASLYTLLIKH